MRMAIESERKLQEAEASEEIGLKEESMFLMYFKVLDKTSEEMHLVTAWLHGLSLRKVQGQVIKGSSFKKSDQDKLVRATCLPS